MRFHHLLVLAGALLWASSASAGAWSKGCGFTGTVTSGAGAATGTPTNTSKVIDNNDIGCWRFIDDDGTVFSSVAAQMDGYIRVTAPSALFVFTQALDEDTSGTPTAAQVVLWLCPHGEAIVQATPALDCTEVSDPLDGAGGGSSTSAAIRVGPGSYTIQITAACADQDVCQVAVIGEGNIQ